MLSFWTFHSINNPKNYGFLQKYKAAQLFSTANHHIRMISGGSCDTEDWNNDADSFNYILKYHENETIILNCNDIPPLL